MLVAFCLIGWAIPAAAEDIPPPGDWDKRHVIELSVYLGAYFPPTTHELYDVDSAKQQPLDVAAADVGLRFGYLPLPFLGLEVEGGLMPTGLRDVDEGAVVYTLRGHLLGQYPAIVTPFLVVGYGMLGIASEDKALGNDLDGAFHAGLGIKYAILSRLLLRLDGRVTISGAVWDGGYKPHFEALLSVNYQLWYKDNRPDRDGDGLIDIRDKCPDVAAKTTDGCPPDTDKDGIIDAEDKCPKTAAKTADGCPPDRDKDGIIDAKDKCPDKKGVKPHGCPDKDGDGVIDSKDKCPDVAAKTADGCPPDRDKDGIIDAKDKCPDDPETKNGYQDGDGCPDELPKKVKRFKGIIKGINFDYDSDKIRRKSFKVLNAAAKVLEEYAELRLRIRGHADDRGTEEYNVDLSRRRAESVKRHLVSQGVAEGRLETEGVGTAEPLEPGMTGKARAKNRRIEFKILTGAATK